jgi:hypothetical protein
MIDVQLLLSRKKANQVYLESRIIVGLAGLWTSSQKILFRGQSAPECDSKTPFGTRGRG